MINIRVMALLLGVILAHNAEGAVKHVHPHVITPHPRPAWGSAAPSSFNTWRSQDVITALKNSGLEIAEMAPGLVVSAPSAQDSMVFLIPSYGSGIGGMVATYSREKDLEESALAYASMNGDKGSPVWWIFRKDNVLLLISGAVPEAKARLYEKALQGM